VLTYSQQFVTPATEESQSPARGAGTATGSQQQLNRP